MREMDKERFGEVFSILCSTFEEFKVFNAAVSQMTREEFAKKDEDELVAYHADLDSCRARAEEFFYYIDRFLFEVKYAKALVKDESVESGVEWVGIIRRFLLGYIEVLRGHKVTVEMAVKRKVYKRFKDTSVDY